ncbi:hypothetical protein MTO96_022530 [Rhipicephalus appendiculatus]
MIVLFAALLFAAPPPIGLAPTGSKPPGVLWWRLRTAGTTRYTSAIAHGGALSRVEVALGTPHGSVVYYNDNPPADVAARLFSPNYPNYPSGVPPLVPFPQGYVPSFGSDGPPVPTQRFIGQVDHSQLPVSLSSLGPRIGARAPPSVPLVAPGTEDRRSHQPPFSAIVRSRPVLSQPVGPVLQSGSPLYSSHPNQPQSTTKKAAVITLVVTPGSSPALGTTQGVEAAEAISARPTPPQVHAPFPTAEHEIPSSVSTDERELESSDTLPESDVQDSTVTYEEEENVKQLSGNDDQSSSTVASVGLQTSQSQDTSSVVKNQIKTPRRSEQRQGSV